MQEKSKIEKFDYFVLGGDLNTEFSTQPQIQAFTAERCAENKATLVTEVGYETESENESQTKKDERLLTYAAKRGVMNVQLTKAGQYIAKQLDHIFVAGSSSSKQAMLVKIPESKVQSYRDFAKGVITNSKQEGKDSKIDICNKAGTLCGVVQKGSNAQDIVFPQMDFIWGKNSTRSESSRNLKKNHIFQYHKVRLCLKPFQQKRAINVV